MTHLPSNSIFYSTALALMLWVGFSQPHLQAAQITVSSANNAGAGTLREAIVSASPGDTIIFSVVGMIPLDTQIVIDKNLWIFGPGAGKLAISGQDTTRLFAVTPADTVHFSGLTFRNGSAAYEPIPAGGAISNEGFIHLSSCVFFDNYATSGGAIENVAGSEGDVRVELKNCTFYNNRAVNPSTLPILKAGGAITSNGRDGGTARIIATNCTFSGNESAQSGGAIFIIGAPAGGVSFEGLNCTFTKNIANGGGAIDNAQAEPLILKNTLVAGNLGIPLRPDLFGAVQSLGHNVIGDTGSVILVNPVVPTDIIEVDAGIGPLADNGSGLPTHSLQCGSPAIDAGDDTAAPLGDQRGKSRLGTSDIGAYERYPSLDILITNTKNDGAGSLRQAILLACPGETLDLSGISGIIHLESPLPVTQDITLAGNPIAPVELNGNDSIRIMAIPSSVTTAFSWLSFTHGYSELFGGGAIQNKGNSQFQYCTFADNYAASGGAISNYGDGAAATLLLDNCTFARNTASPLDGGAIDNRLFTDAATIDILNCTFSSNTAEAKGGALYNGIGNRIHFRNTLIANNTAPLGQDLFDESGMDLISQGHNLIEHHANSIYVGDSMTDVREVDPIITPLGLFGGPTPTYRLLAGSPAIDAGDNLDVGALDQRGEARIFGTAVDIGAYEYDPATSLTERLTRPSLTFYPNPAKDHLTIKGEFETGALTWNLYNLSGQLLSQEEIELYSPSTTLGIKLPSLPAGLYLIQVRQMGQQQFGKLIIE